MGWNGILEVAGFGGLAIGCSIRGKHYLETYGYAIEP
jgi:hypothetical protein